MKQDTGSDKDCEFNLRIKRMRDELQAWMQTVPMKDLWWINSNGLVKMKVNNTTKGFIEQLLKKHGAGGNYDYNWIGYFISRSHEPNLKFTDIETEQLHPLRSNHIGWVKKYTFSLFENPFRHTGFLLPESIHPSREEVIEAYACKKDLWSGNSNPSIRELITKSQKQAEIAWGDANGLYSVGNNHWWPKTMVQYYDKPVKAWAHHEQEVIRGRESGGIKYSKTVALIDTQRGQKVIGIIPSFGETRIYWDSPIENFYKAVTQAKEAGDESKYYCDEETYQDALASVVAGKL